MAKEFVVSGDSHVVEPVNLFVERLPKNLRHKALRQTEMELEPFVPGGHTVFRTVHAPGYEGWTVSRYRQHTGPTPDWHPDQIMTDMNRDGIDASILFSNFALFATYTDDHEVAMAHTRVYNDWLAETYLGNNRFAPLASIPTTDVPDAVAEIERAANTGMRGLFMPEHPQPLPYWHESYEPIWAAAEHHGLPIFFHLAAGGANTKTGNSITGDNVKGILTAMALGKHQKLNSQILAARTGGGGQSSGAVPMRIISELIGSGVCERHPDLLFSTIEYNAGWLANFMSMMDKSWRTGTGQDPNWWVGFMEDGKPMTATRPDGSTEELFGRLFTINDRWPYPLKPSEYVKRNVRVQFADDRMAVQARHITGVDTIFWGNDYPHAEGTWLGSQAVIEEQMFDVPDDERAKMLGGTLASIVGIDTSTKYAPDVHPDALPVAARA
jgi:predicted TIM-barrel fold metal-dependent hydrolase